MSSSPRAVTVFLVLTVCIASLPMTAHCFDFQEWFQKTFNTAKPIDCAFTHWESWQSCTQTSSGKMQHERTRSMSQPKNNGKACPKDPDLTQWADCSDIEIVADKFIAVLHSTGPAPTDDTVWERCKSHLNNYIGSPPCDLWCPKMFTVTRLRYIHYNELTENEFVHYLLFYHPELPDYCTRVLYRHEYIPFCAPLFKRFNVTYQYGSKVPCIEVKSEHTGDTLITGGQCGANSRGKRNAQSMNEKQRMKRDALTMRNSDIVFLLDESGSVGKDRFENTILGLAKALTRSLCGTRIVSSEKTRIGVASFDKDNHGHFNLKNANMDDAAGLIEAIGQIKYNETTAGSTCLASSLRYCRDHMFHPDRGARINDKTEQSIILITDGCANCETDDLEHAAEYLYNASISLLTFFIGKSQHCKDTMQKLDTKANEKCYKLVPVETWEKAELLRQTFEKKGCKSEQEEDNKLLSNVQNSCY